MNRLRSTLLAATAMALVAGIAHAGEMTFTAIEAPTEDAAKRTVNVTPSVMIDGTKVDLKWNTIARSGDKIGDNNFGVQVDAAGNRLFHANGAPSVSDDADFTSLLPVEIGRAHV